MPQLGTLTPGEGVIADSPRGKVKVWWVLVSRKLVLSQAPA